MLFFVILAAMVFAAVRGWAWYAPVVAAVVAVPIALVQNGVLSSDDWPLAGELDQSQVWFNLGVSVAGWFVAYWLTRWFKSRPRKA